MKPNFNAAGVQQKFSALYAMSDSDLFIQAEAIRGDLKAWLQNNFTFESHQQLYLDGLNADFLLNAGDNTSFAVRYRRPINVEFPIEVQPASKLIRMVNTTTPTNTGTGIAVEGSLSFIIFYE